MGGVAALTLVREALDKLPDVCGGLHQNAPLAARLLATGIIVARSTRDTAAVAGYGE